MEGNGGLLTGRGQSSQSANFWKIAKMALFKPCMKFNNFLAKRSGKEYVLLVELYL